MRAELDGWSVTALAAARSCLSPQAFLDMKQLMSHLEAILRQCRELCMLVQVRAALLHKFHARGHRCSCLSCYQSARLRSANQMSSLVFLLLVATQRLADGSIGVEAAAAGLKAISKDFQLKQRTLYHILQSSRLGSRAPALRQLIMRLNFNGFADKQARLGALGGGGGVTAAGTAPASLLKVS